MKWLLIFIFTANTFFQNDPCKDFKQHSKDILKVVNNKMIGFANPYYLSKKELFSIVYPEFITFNAAKNNLEIILIKSNLYLDNNKFDLSFGPFQMKISFILKTLNHAPKKIIKDPILVKLKNNNNELTSTQIDYLNRIETQWEILRVFEYCNLNNYKKHTLNGLYTLYNRGDINKKTTVFDKIKCKDMTYEEWCNEFLKLE
jgi:hypothetical protein